jgi:hypothetical protein
MRLPEHVALGGAAAAALYPIVGEKCLLFWAASVLIDVDHYWDFLYRNGFKDFSVRRMFKFHDSIRAMIHRPDFIGINLFHTLEWLALCYVISRVTGSSYIQMMLAGMVFHFFLDVLWMIYLRAPFKRAYSIIEYVVRFRRMERQGLLPHRFYQDVLKKMEHQSTNLIRAPYKT